jgi:hypothetical protein
MNAGFQWIIVGVGRRVGSTAGPMGSRVKSETAVASEAEGMCNYRNLSPDPPPTLKPFSVQTRAQDQWKIDYERCREFVDEFCKADCRGRRVLQN